MILDTRINTTTTGSQRISSVTTLTDGDFVVTWDSNGDRTLFGIFGQRYDASGNKQGAEFGVNSNVGYQWGPSVTALTDGGFVVTWNSKGQDGSLGGVYAQRYDASGNRQGTEFRVNSYTKDGQGSPSVTALNDGSFVVTWTSEGQDGSSFGIYAQRYDANGNTQGAEFRVNSSSNVQSSFSSMTAFNDGGFVVTWKSGANIHGQRYDVNGNAQGAEFLINSDRKSMKHHPSVTTLNDGDFVVTWGSTSQDGSGRGIYGQRYDANGNPLGAEFRVNSYTKDSQFDSSVIALTGGGFVVIWSSIDQDRSSFGIYGQRFDASGNMQGAEFGVNSFTTGLQMNSSVTALNDGGFVVTWGSNNQVGTSFDIYGKRYDANGNEIEWLGNINAALESPAVTLNSFDIERLISTESGLAFDLNDSAGSVAKLIGAVFGAESVSNAGYVATGLYYLDHGTSNEDLATGAIAFTDAKTPEQVTSLLWNNVMGSPPTENEIQPYINMLNSGTSIGELVVLAASTSENSTNIDFVGLVGSGLIFDPLFYQPIG